jgi:hypothetical protein
MGGEGVIENVGQARLAGAFMILFLLVLLLGEVQIRASA